MRRIRTFTTGLLTCALLLVSCGGDDDPEADLDPTGSVTEQGPVGLDPTEGPAATADPTTDPASPTPRPTATTPTASGEVYEVQSGDTLSGIAQRFNTTVEALVEANGLDDPNALFPGDELTIPAGPPE